MPSLLVVVLLIELAAHVINLVGAAALNDIIWNAVNYLPLPTSKAAAEHRQLQREYLKARGEMTATSSQDEFAKWAKLRRNHDKLLDKLEKAKKSQEATRASFDRYLSGARMLLTRAPQYALPFWYSREPMFWLPHGWFPYYAEWIISFPRAPLGSVSIASWQLACRAFITLLSDMLRGLFGLLTASKAAPAKQKEAPMKAAAADEKSTPKKKKAAASGKKTE